ncbi:MAG: serine/threonine protein kinase [Myxococcales bacterium]|nr:serine/threonine protein kinase [Myxococcales bacterium]
MGSIIEDRYRLERLLGSGGMSRVYLGTHVRAGGKLAIKLVDLRLSHKQDMVQRCLQEARTMMEIQSNHVVRAYDTGVTSTGQLYIVMEYLAGLDLEQLLNRDGPLPWTRLAPMAVHICSGLATAHAAGTIHRDIKPQNCIAVTIDGNPDHIKLIDFGIARDANAETGLTQDGAILGTPEYMAPELVGTGNPPDARSDIYAVGATLYKLITGQAPFRGRDALDTLYKHRNSPVIPPSKAAPNLDIPPEADAILVKALAKDPAQRYATADEMAAAIRESVGLPAIGMRMRDLPGQGSQIPRSPTARIAAASIPRSLTSNEASSPGHMAPGQEIATSEMRPVSLKELGLRMGTLLSVALCFAVSSWLAAPSSPATPAATTAVAEAKAPEPAKEATPPEVKPPEAPKDPPAVDTPPTTPPPTDAPTDAPPTTPTVDTPPPTPTDTPPGDTKQAAIPTPTPAEDPPIEVPDEPKDPPPATPPTTPSPAGDPEPDFDYRSAKKYVDEQRDYMAKTCLPMADKPTSKVSMRFDVKPGGRAVVKVFSSSKKLRDCVRQIFAFPFDPSPRGGAFVYNLSASGGSIEKKPVE